MYNYPLGLLFTYACTIVTYDLNNRPSSTPSLIFEPVDVDIKETLGNEKVKILLGGENDPTTESIYSKAR
jgi:hypothetical protein